MFKSILPWLALLVNFIQPIKAINSLNVPTRPHKVTTNTSSTIKPNIISTFNKDNYLIEAFVNAQGVEKVLKDEYWMAISRIEDETSGGISDKCCVYLDTFTNSTAKFMKCVMSNARPLHYCANCVDEYTSVMNAYNDITNETGTQAGKKSCKEQILRADNVQVVLLAHDFVENVWKKSTCVNCYQVERVNDTVMFTPTNYTIEMLKEINATLSCMRDLAVTDSNLNESVCKLCRQLYNKANNFYNSLEGSDKLCSDLVDSMNYTRLMWSKHYNCTVIERGAKDVIGIAIAIGLLPVILYSLVYVWGKQKNKRQRRHTGRRHRASTSNTASATPHALNDDTNLLHDHDS